MGNSNKFSITRIEQLQTLYKKYKGIDIRAWRQINQHQYWVWIKTSNSTCVRGWLKEKTLEWNELVCANDIHRLDTNYDFTIIEGATTGSILFSKYAYLEMDCSKVKSGYKLYKGEQLEFDFSK